MKPFLQLVRVFHFCSLLSDVWWNKEIVLPLLENKTFEEIYSMYDLIQDIFRREKLFLDDSFSSWNFSLHCCEI